MKQETKVTMSGINFHDVHAKDIQVTLHDHGWFSTIEISIGKMDVTLFTEDINEAKSIMKSMQNFKISDNIEPSPTQELINN